MNTLKDSWKGKNDFVLKIFYYPPGHKYFHITLQDIHTISSIMLYVKYIDRVGFLEPKETYSLRDSDVYNWYLQNKDYYQKEVEKILIKEML